MKSRVWARRLPIGTIFSPVLVLACCTLATAAAPESARQILDTTGTQGGVVVHVGCGDGQLTAALRAGAAYTVHGLDTDPAKVERARRRIQSLDLYGPVSVDQFDGRHLPYIDNLVNLLVAEDLGQLSMGEVTRVLAPRGVAYVKTGGRWTKTQKPWPAQCDEWTHWMHDASGNGVAKDQVVGPPRHYQWLARPYWSKHHDTVLTTSAMVSAGGRNFYIGDEEEPSSIFSDAYEGKWFLVARDAFNGTLLWKRAIAAWGWKEWGQKFHDRFAQPMQLPCRLVAAGNTVYATLGFHEPVTALDAATGKTLMTYENSNYADEILLHQGRLVLSTYSKEDLDVFRAARPGKPGKGTNNDSLPKTVRVLDAASGKVLWERGPFVGLAMRYDVVQGYDGLSLTAHEDRVVLLTPDAIHCLELESGKTRWQKARPPRDEYRMTLGVRQSENCTVVNAKDVVLFTQPRGNKPHTNHTNPCDLYALDARTGKDLWSHACGVTAWGHPADVFVIDGVVWIHNHDPGPRPWPGAEIPADILPNLDYCLLGLDLHSGELKRKVPTGDIFQVGHHHRCYRNKATEKYIFTARRGTELTDVATGDTWLQHWLRSECRYGNMPANGLLYSAPHPCGCYMGVLLKGYSALAGSDARAADKDRGVADDARLVVSGQLSVVSKKTGDRSQESLNSRSLPPVSLLSPLSSSHPNPHDHAAHGARIPNPSSWPTYRADIARSGHAKMKLPVELKPAWEARIGGRLSSLTVGEGQCYVAAIDTHTVHALDAARGARLWSYTVGARVDSPPTVCRDRVVFGSSDGWVYCLRAADGALVWKFLAAPQELRMSVDSQLESVWPVHGSVLVREGEVSLMAGRSSYLDGGITAYRLKLNTGELIEKKQIYSADPKTDKQVRGDTFDVPGSQSHVLVSDGRSVYQLDNCLFGDGKFTKPYLAATADFLDDSLFVRTWWGLVGAGQAYASMLVHDDRFVYGFRPYPSPGRDHLHVVGVGYPLFCVPIEAAKDLPSEGYRQFISGGSFMGKARPRKLPNRWDAKTDVLVRAMLLTDDALVVAGPPDAAEPTDPYAAFEGRKGGKLVALSPESGKVLREVPLESPPVWDGMAAAEGRLYVSTMGGKVVCFGKPEQ
jgi:outer membrane protein assembly factor BamB